MKKVGRIVVVSNNPAKVERFGKLLSNYFSEVVGLKDLGHINKPEETGETAEENAEIKGLYYAKRLGLLVFSEDEALYVDFLSKDKQPGTHVRRIEGKEGVSDRKLLTYWENIISKVPKNKRTGKWHIAYCIASPNGKVITTALDHPIVFFSPSSMIKIPGWPMSSLEGPLVFNKPHSELTEEERKTHEQSTNQHITEKLNELMEGLK